jgi:Holliday junction resolvase RusA-like endonuclease
MNHHLIEIPIVPLSVNQAWKGRRYKTDKYKKYENDVLILLPKKKISSLSKLSVDITYRFSSKASDVDNPTKLILDILQKKYFFDDCLIYDLHLHKEIVQKGKESILIKITEIDDVSNMSSARKKKIEKDIKGSVEKKNKNERSPRAIPMRLKKNT